jgi:hypothetical protein
VAKLNLKAEQELADAAELDRTIASQKLDRDDLADFRATQLRGTERAGIGVVVSFA